MRFLKLKSNAVCPTKAKDGDAGYDLYAAEAYTLRPCERLVVSTGIAVEIPEGYYGRIAPRSGLAVKAGLDVLAGVIDSGYRNEIGVVLINLNIYDFFLSVLSNSQRNQAFDALFGFSGDFKIKPGDKIAQLIIEPYLNVIWEEASSLSVTDRNLSGFGSTDAPKA